MREVNGDLGHSIKRQNWRRGGTFMRHNRKGSASLWERRDKKEIHCDLKEEGETGGTPFK